MPLTGGTVLPTALTRIASYLQRNALALTAIFIALGGSSYAALSIPNGSVGTRQLKNGAVTPAKLNASLIGGSVRAWAYVAASGTILASHGFKGRVHISNGSPPGTYFLALRTRAVHGCAALASVAPATGAGPPSGPGFADGSVVVQPEFPNVPPGTGVSTYSPAGQPTALPFVVEVLC